MFRLEGKSVLVTGATGHLGKEIAFALAEHGAHVYVNGRNIERCEEVASAITKTGRLASVASFDVTDESQVRSFTQSVDLLDVVVSNSYAGKGGTVESAESCDYAASYQSSVIATANLVKALLPHLRRAAEENGYASVISIASMYGIVSPDQRIYDSAEGTNPPFYGAAKAGLIQWTKYAACEFAQENIRFNSISPGPFPSNWTQKNFPTLIEKIVSKVPMKRIGRPDELTGAIVFLASPASSFITGINLAVDGGWTAW